MCTLSSRRGGVAALALVAALLGACGGDDGPDDGGDGGGTVAEVPLGTSQLSAANRATIAARLGAVAAEMASTDPAGAAVVQAIGGAVAAEGWVNGVEATSARSLVADGRGARGNLSAQNTWAVFGAEIGVVTSTGPVTGYAVRGVVALRDSTIVVGYNKWDINDAFQPQHTFGNGPESVGLVFEGSTRKWNATAGSVQITSADSLPSQCSGFPRDGISCTNSSHASGSIGISTSVPEPGTGASGSYTFFFGQRRLRGYVLLVDCQQSSQC